MKVSMAFMAASGVAARIGYAACFMAMEFGIVGAVVVYARQ